ncbi:hypothetical protein P4O66_000810 [Electrophorus voltai]|uniref:TIR domain-containing protein n=1 Tax=Electrophorus voltai TaxID=2609070 RepID=A0AAD8ZDP0_9TELE|nr:hypothetical protein P4O66_000810 [Electrophorus voltai]
MNASAISWFKNDSNGIQQIPAEESARVHYHGAILYILPLALNDTGRYITRWWYEYDKCDEFETDVVVYEEFHTDQLYGNFSEQTTTVEMLCPVCEKQEKNLTWYKDFHLIPGQTEWILRVRHTSKKDDGIYTCVCSWEHYGQTFKSSGSHQLQIVDGKVYDAYVIYQKDNMDDETEKNLAHFISTVLPTVLEDKCGFKLFIHGRDDLPGEDSLELTDARMQLSRRLIVVLTPGVSKGQKVMTPKGYDWHVGLHQVLVQQEMSAILIQLGGMSKYSELPLGLQHLLWKTPPLRWDSGSPQAACPGSRFWKQVRYMMPVPTAAAYCPKSSSPRPNFSQA